MANNWILSKKEILRLEQASKTQKIKKNTKTKFRWRDLPIKFLYVVFVFAIFTVAQNFWFATFLILISVGIGAWFPRWYLLHHKPNKKFVSIIVWSNLITWLVPAIGIGAAMLTLTFHKYLLGGFKQRARALGIISLVLTFISAIVGVLLTKGV